MEERKKETMQKLIIILLVLLCIWLFWRFVVKPYYTKFDTTLCYTGGLGQGKTLNAVKDMTDYYLRTVRRIKIRNWFITKINKIRKNKPDIELEEIPGFYSNFPVLLKRGTKRKDPIYSYVLYKEHLMLNNPNFRIEDGSVILIDEMPQLVNQFNWNIKEVQQNLNEFITYFRHYINGKFCMTAQSIDDVVVQIRRKMNEYYQLFGFQRILFIFYRVQIVHLPTSDNISNVSNTFIEENAKWKYGCLLPKRYNSRCYMHRYDKITTPTHKEYKQDCTNKVIRMGSYNSPLDD